MMIETAKITINPATVIIKVLLPHSQHGKEASLAHVREETSLCDPGGPRAQGLL